MTGDLQQLRFIREADVYEDGTLAGLPLTHTLRELRTRRAEFTA